MADYVSNLINDLYKHFGVTGDGSSDLVIAEQIVNTIKTMLTRELVLKVGRLNVITVTGDKAEVGIKPELVRDVFDAVNKMDGACESYKDVLCDYSDKRYTVLGDEAYTGIPDYVGLTLNNLKCSDYVYYAITKDIITCNEFYTDKIGILNSICRSDKASLDRLKVFGVNVKEGCVGKLQALSDYWHSIDKKEYESVVNEGILSDEVKKMFDLVCRSNNVHTRQVLYRVYKGDTIQRAIARIKAMNKVYSWGHDGYTLSQRQMDWYDIWLTRALRHFLMRVSKNDGNIVDITESDVDWEMHTVEFFKDSKEVFEHNRFKMI